ncbi:hypothetical protein MUK42_17923 [Musa troglodytarum]|uniref:Uncharacterized protein n=1 Tax=Musa troglodytarum TaxID=320322 RepID=A0A9E7HYS0_9LILI|nr:hypothetical protein MUK42_17923 [Musa troglodytarum]
MKDGTVYSSSEHRGRTSGGGGGNLVRRELALGLVRCTAAGLAIQKGLAVLVELKLRDDDLGGVDADVHGGAVHLLAGDALDVDDPLPTVDLHDLALAALEGTAHHLHLVVFAHRNRPHVVFVPQVGRQGRAHQHSPDARWSREVRLPALPPGARHTRVVLHRGRLALGLRLRRSRGDRVSEEEFGRRRK